VNYYPIHLDITDRSCIVVGGGDVAERKVQRLLECGGHVIVIAKALTPALETMTKEGRIHWIDDIYSEAYIRNAFLVIGATDRTEINAKISADARKSGVMVNIVDDPEKCDFILPSVFQRGDLSIAVSTGGKSPALAKKLREDMENLYGPEYKTLLAILGKLRQKVKDKGQSYNENKRLFEAVVNSDILQFIREKNWNRVNKMIRDMTGEDIEAEE